ncbi:Transposase family protein, DDE domain-containing [Desulfonema limicola]|uniref:Transposase DDE domain-containing protein n=1 Tax=Desulfonema limicola TaxID=45656 RepID=A0A975BDC8_9BACT|nr:transposase [Desulfonema limicola]QTA80580.1 Transposase DDE domain-containing protein [Desulfonema limicola]QTA83110.1 Transposase family protein, DDE domain-containing [Desulfonema limicola]
MSHIGSALTLAEKKLVVHVKHYFDREKKLSLKNNKDICVDNSARRAAQATNLSEVTVWRIMAEYNKNKTLSSPVPKGSSPYAVNDCVKTICQDIIRSYNIRREHLSLRLLAGILNDEFGIAVARETLRRSLYRWKILHGSVQRHTALRERDYVVKARREYLIRKRYLNNSKRMLVYLDETFINKNYSGSDSAWYCSDWNNDSRLDKSFGPYINKPAGKGERFIILNAVTKDGWVNGTQLVFQANRRTGDYHGSMEEENFTRWLTTQLLPNIADNSVIIMDNAPYHNMFLEDNVPALTSSKSVLQKWLTENNIAFSEDFLRIQLIDLINQHRPQRMFKLDFMLRNDPLYKDRNIEILRTPQYHPELQPIEKCWAVMKQYMARHCNFTLKGLRKNLETAWTKVTSETMEGIMEKVTFWENHHFEQDSLLDSIDDKYGANYVEDDE